MKEVYVAYGENNEVSTFKIRLRMLNKDAQYLYSIFDIENTKEGYFNSAIRNNQPITLCIASSRMKKLFIEWLNSDD